MTYNLSARPLSDLPPVSLPSLFQFRFTPFLTPTVRVLTVFFAGCFSYASSSLISISTSFFFDFFTTFLSPVN